MQKLELLGNQMIVLFVVQIWYKISIKTINMDSQFLQYCCHFANYAFSI